MSDISEHMVRFKDTNRARDASYPAAVPDNLDDYTAFMWMRHYGLRSVLVIDHKDGMGVGAVEYRHLKSLNLQPDPDTVLAWSVGSKARCPYQKPDFHVSDDDKCSSKKYLCKYHEDENGKPICHANKVR